MSRVWGGTVVAAVAATVLACAPAASATNFTWVGDDTSSSNWSATDNWSTGVAPAPPIGTLTFFGDLGAGCDAGTSDDACYDSTDDLGPLIVSGLSIDSDSPYDLEPNDVTDTLTLDPTSGFGIDTTASGTADNGPAEIDVPVNAANTQTWAVAGDGDADGGDGLIVSQLSADALTVDLTDDGTLYLQNATSTMPIEATGDGSGFLALAGPQPSLSSGAELDAGTGFVDLSPGATSAPITIDSNPGPEGFVFAVGGGSPPDGTLQINGPQSFGSTTTLNLYIDDNGNTPSTDYSQLTTINGGVSFGGASLDLSQGNTSSGGCARLTPGETETLISSPVGLTGSVAYSDWQGNPGTLVGGETSSPIALDPCINGSTTISSYATLTYGAHAITATIVTRPQASTQPSTVTGNPTAGQIPTLGATQQQATTASPTVDQVRSALASIAQPSGRRSIRALLRSGSFNARFHAPSGGVLRITWTATRTTGTGRHRKRRRVTILTGVAHTSSAEPVQVTVHLNARGRELLKTHPRDRPLVATERFRPTGASWVQITKRFRL